MPITDPSTGTRIDEIARGIYRISTPIRTTPAGFSFNQYLIAATEPLLFHTGPRKLFPYVREAVRSVLPPESLRYVALSHVEGDECGSLREWLALAPSAEPVCSKVAAIVYVNDAVDGNVRALKDDEVLDLGGHAVTWFDTPHVPHGWECGYLWESTTRTLLCGDLFTQAGADQMPLTQHEIVSPSEAMRARTDYFAHAPNTRRDIERLAALEPRVLACMHGSAFEGDGRAQLIELASALSRADVPSR